MLIIKRLAVFKALIINDNRGPAGMTEPGRNDR
jgi:hypothetical protein